MADKEISNLPELEAVTDETMLPAYQPGAQNPAQRISGAQFREFAQAAVGEHTAAAQQAAQTAQTAAGQAQNAAGAAANQAANQAVAEVQNQLQGLVRDAQSAAGQSATQADRAEAAAKRAEAATDWAANEIVNTASGEVVAVNDSAERPLRGLTLYGKTTQNGTPSPDSPVPLESAGNDGTVGVTVSVKNLCNGIYVSGIRTDPEQVNPDPNGVYVSVDFRIPAKGMYTFSFDAEVTIVRINRTEVNYNGTVFPLEFEPGVHVLSFRRSDRVVWDSTTKVQLEWGAVATEYEPYKEAQTLTVQTPNGLPGIPVSSGGNYTDETGQQWICDEVDFGRGKYVQRVNKAVLNGTETWAKFGVANGVTYGRWQTVIVGLKDYDNDTVFDGYVSHFGKTTASKAYGGNGLNCVAVQTQGYVNVYTNYASVDAFKAFLNTNNVTFMGVLATPIETDLTAEELAQYAALHTNYPNTTIYNDSGAGMAVSYVADTKLYIDNKFAQLAAAMLNS